MGAVPGHTSGATAVNPLAKIVVYEQPGVALAVSTTHQQTPVALLDVIMQPLWKAAASVAEWKEQQEMPNTGINLPATTVVATTQASTRQHLAPSTLMVNEAFKKYKVPTPPATQDFYSWTLNMTQFIADMELRIKCQASELTGIEALTPNQTYTSLSSIWHGHVLSVLNKHIGDHPAGQANATRDINITQGREECDLSHNHHFILAGISLLEIRSLSKADQLFAKLMMTLPSGNRPLILQVLREHHITDFNSLTDYITNVNASLKIISSTKHRVHHWYSADDCLHAIYFINPENCSRCGEARELRTRTHAARRCGRFTFRDDDFSYRHFQVIERPDNVKRTSLNELHAQEVASIEPTPLITEYATDVTSSIQLTKNDFITDTHTRFGVTPMAEIIEKLRSRWEAVYFNGNSGRRLYISKFRSEALQTDNAHPTSRGFLMHKLQHREASRNGMLTTRTEVADSFWWLRMRVDINRFTKCKEVKATILSTVHLGSTKDNAGWSFAPSQQLQTQLLQEHSVLGSFGQKPSAHCGSNSTSTTTTNTWRISEKKWSPSRLSYLNARPEQHASIPTRNTRSGLNGFHPDSASTHQPGRSH